VKRVLLAGGALILVLGIGASAYFRLRRMSQLRAPTAAEVEQLVRERGQLRDEVRDLLTQQNLLDWAQAPSGNVLVGGASSLSERLISQVVTGLLSEVRLHLTNLRAHHEDDVKAKVLFKKRRVGHFSLDVDIKEVRAVLKPGPPRLTFGADRIGIELPVDLTAGRGEASLHFQWDGKGLAGAMCGDVDVRHDVSSRVKPTTYTVKGDFLLSAQGETVVADPDFGVIELDVRLDPGAETWQAFEATVEDVKDDKNGMCRMAIKNIDVTAIVKKIIDKGFKVKLPGKLFRPIALPATVEQSVEFQGKVVSLNVRPIGLRVTPTRMWYGVEFDSQAEGPAPPSPAPAEPPRARGW